MSLSSSWLVSGACFTAFLCGWYGERGYVSMVVICLLFTSNSSEVISFISLPRVQPDHEEPEWHVEWLLDDTTMHRMSTTWYMPETFNPAIRAMWHTSSIKTMIDVYVVNLWKKWVVKVIQDWHYVPKPTMHWQQWQIMTFFKRLAFILSSSWCFKTFLQRPYFFVAS